MTKAHTPKLMTMPSDCHSVSQSDGHTEKGREKKKYKTNARNVCKKHFCLMLIKMPALSFGVFGVKKMCDKPSFAAICCCSSPCFSDSLNRNILTAQVGQKQQATGSCLAKIVGLLWLDEWRVQCLDGQQLK